MNKVSSEMEGLAKRAEELAGQIKSDMFCTETAARELRENAQAWKRYARAVVRLERHLKLSDSAEKRIIDLELELAQAHERIAQLEAEIETREGAV